MFGGVICSCYTSKQTCTHTHTQTHITSSVTPFYKTPTIQQCALTPQATLISLYNCLLIFLTPLLLCLCITLFLPVSCGLCVL